MKCEFNDNYQAISIDVMIDCSQPILAFIEDHNITHLSLNVRNTDLDDPGWKCIFNYS